MTDLPPPSVLAHLTDVHCHPTDAKEDGVPTKSMEQLQIRICAMSSNQSDQDHVKDLAIIFPDKVTPAFGHHPWFSHWISTESSLSGVSNDNGISEKEKHYRNLLLPHGNSDPSLETEFSKLLPQLPDPTPLSAIINTLSANLSTFQSAMLGEVGLDRSFRVPLDYLATPRILTSFHIPLEHQLEVLEAQMGVSLEMGRNVSFHSVRCQLATFEAFERMRKKWGEERWKKISIDLHSCGFSKQGWIDLEVGRQILVSRTLMTALFSQKKHDNVFMSLSSVINHKHPNFRELIAVCSPDRILAESDYNDIDQVTPQTWDIVKIIAEVRGWPLEMEWRDDPELEEKDWGVVRRLERNWNRFKAGNYFSTATKRNRKVVDHTCAGPEAEEP